MGHYECKECGQEYSKCACPEYIKVDKERVMGDSKKWLAENMCDKCEHMLDECVCDKPTVRLPMVNDRYKEVSDTMGTRLENLAIQDARTVTLKNRQYGESWCKRGGQQAFAVIARKWDRLETILGQMHNGYDIFDAWEDNPGGVRDDIQDLRQYLLLLEEYCNRNIGTLQGAETPAQEMGGTLSGAAAALDPRTPLHNEGEDQLDAKLRRAHLEGQKGLELSLDT